MSLVNINVVVNNIMKCSKCNQEVESLFLGKIKGTYVDKEIVCNECQKKPQ